MNSERRHELQSNELASVLNRVNEAIDPYSKPIAVIVIGLFIAAIGWGVYASQQSDKRSDATLQLMEASASGNSELLADIATKFPGTSAAAWSKVYLASQKLAEGINSLFLNRGEAEDLLAEARSAYEDALTMSDDPVLRSRAYFGLARIAESLGDVDEAIKNYESAMVAGESEAMATEAKRRIERLAQPQTKEFLLWFNDQNFAPADPALPPSLPGASLLPDSPDVKLPELDLSDLVPAANDAEMKSDEVPESTDAPATESKLMDVKTSDQPAAVEAPNAKPTDETPAEKPTDTVKEAVEEPVKSVEPVVETPSKPDAD